MKTFQIVFELADVPAWDAAADPLVIEFTQSVSDDKPRQLDTTAKVIGLRMLQDKAKAEGKTINAGDMVRVLIYDLKERRPLLRPTVTTWMVGRGIYGLAMLKTTFNAAQLLPSLN
ncbi:hypothetical protein AB1K70_26530 [Bremerella sp. JC770]|uniref:hypothetical protein n=1 Tax=Bremerella sp. JC770 TaxID=3232137 RepID=UPI00345B3263